MRPHLVRTVVVLTLGAAALVACSDAPEAADDLGDKTIRSVEVVTQGGDYREAIDATLSPTADQVYFAANSSRGPGVFRVAASGGSAEPVFTGIPFKRPAGIATATDGSRVFLSDSEADGIFSLALSGGTPVPVPGTAGTTPRGLEVVREGNGDALYFAGRDPADGRQAVLRIPAEGANGPTVVSKGALAFPDAVTVTKEDVVYATDRGMADGQGAVFRISGSSPTKLADLRAPVLAGLTLNLDESVLLVSALSPQGTDQVLVIDLTAGRTGIFSKTIGENRAGGGLHRARQANVFAWADLTAGPDRQSRVYVLRG